MCMHLTVNIQSTENKDDTIKVEEKSIIIVGIFNTLLSVVDRTSRQENSVKDLGD